MKISNIKKYTDYLLLILLVAVTGFPFFYSDIEFVILGFLFSLFIFVKRKLKFNRKFITVITFFLVIEILQSIYFNSFEALTFFGTYIRFGFAYFTVAALGDRFFDYYFNIIYFFAVISLIFFIPSIINNDFANLIVNNIATYFKSPFYEAGESIYEISPNIIIYTFEKSLFVSSRNSGPFWEPGAFGVFIILAIMFRLIYTHRILTFKIVLLSIALLTTTSTSGYIALFLLLVLHYSFNKRVGATKYALILMMIYGGGLMYLQIEFLGAKANEDIILASETTTSRFGSALIDLQDFSRNPILGYGRGQNRYGGREITFFSVDQHRNNGMTQLLVTYGIIIFILYFLMYYKAIVSYCKRNRFNKKFAYAALLIIFILGFSQGIFTRPFFYALLFVDYKKINLTKEDDALFV